jgi:hypothetical protein
LPYSGGSSPYDGGGTYVVEDSLVVVLVVSSPPLLLRLVVLNVVGVLVKLSVPLLEPDAAVEVEPWLSLSVLVVLLDGTGYVSDAVVGIETVEELWLPVELPDASVLDTVPVCVVPPLGKEESCVVIELSLPEKLLEVADPVE